MSKIITRRRTTTETFANLIDTLDNNDLLFQRNNVTKLTLGDSVSTFSNDLVVSGGDVHTDVIDTASAGNGNFTLKRAGVDLLVVSADDATFSANVIADAGHNIQVSTTGEVISNSFDTVDASDMVLQRNNVTKLTLGDALVTIADDLKISGGDLEVNNIDSSSGQNLVLKQSGTNVLTFDGTDATFEDNITFAGSQNIVMNGGDIKALVIDSAAASDLLLKYNGTTELTVTDGQVTVANNLSVSGNLTVAGTTTTVNTSTLSVTDNIVVANSAPSSTGRDGGFVVERHRDDITSDTAAEGPITVTAGTDTENFTAAGVSGGSDDYYNGWYIKFESGTATAALQDQVYEVTDYVDATNAFVTETMAATPSGTDTFELFNKRKVGFVYDEASDKYELIGFGDDTTDPVGISYLDLKVKSIETTEALSFTSLSLSAATASTSKDTGALVVENGGIGVEGDIFVGGTINMEAGAVQSATGANLELNAPTGQTVQLQVNDTAVMTAGGSSVEMASAIALTGASGANLELNAVTGQAVQLQVNDSAIATVNASGLELASSVALNGASGADLEINAVTGQAVQLQVNDTAIATVNASGLEMASGSAVNAATGSDLELNAPTGQEIEFQINDTAVAKAVSGGLQMVGSNSLSGDSGNNLELNAVTGQSVQLQVNDTAIASVDVDGINLAAGKTLDTLSGDLAIQAAGTTGITISGTTHDVTINNGTLTLNDSTNASDKDSGALIVEGGVGIEKDVFIGLGLNVGGAVNVDSTTNSSSTTTGALIVDGGLGLANNLFMGGNLDVSGTAHIDDETDSSSAVTGALVVDGGIGVAKKVFIGDTTGSTSKDSGALIVEGGVGIEENIYVGGNANITGTLDASGAVNFNDTTESTSVTTGSLIVDGGVGIAKNLNVGGNINFAGATTLTATTISSTSATLATTYSFVIVDTDTAGAAVTLTLPAATGNQGHIYYIIGQGSNNYGVTINRAGSDNFDGDTGITSLALSSDNDRVYLICDGSASWYTF